MATRRARPNQGRPIKKAAPAAPKMTPDATEPDQIPDPATITPDASESPAADESGTETTAPTPDVSPEVAPEVNEDDEVTADPSDPNGDNDGDKIINKYDLDETEFRKGWMDFVNANNIQLPKGHVLFPGEPLTFEGNKLRGNVVEVEEDVYRLVIPFRSKRATFTLVARKGTIMSKTRFLPKDEYRGAIGDLAAPSIEG